MTLYNDNMEFLGQAGSAAIRIGGVIHENIPVMRRADGHLDIPTEVIRLNMFPPRKERRVRAGFLKR
jgi:hypothetical protein